MALEELIFIKHLLFASHDASLSSYMIANLTTIFWTQFIDVTKAQKSVSSLNSQSKANYLNSD